MNITEWGALAFGVVIGWYTYFVNRHRAEVKIADVASIIGAIGGGAVLALFPEQSRLFRVLRDRTRCGLLRLLLDPGGHGPHPAEAAG